MTEESSWRLLPPHRSAKERMPAGDGCWLILLYLLRFTMKVKVDALESVITISVMYVATCASGEVCWCE